MFDPLLCEGAKDLDAILEFRQAAIYSEELDDVVVVVIQEMSRQYDISGSTGLRQAHNESNIIMMNLGKY